MSSSIRPKTQPSTSEQEACTHSATRFRKHTRGDKKIESMIVLQEQSRYLSVSLTSVCDVAGMELFQSTGFPCDARRWSHGGAADFLRRSSSRDVRKWGKEKAKEG